MTMTLVYIRWRQMSREANALGLYTIGFVALAAMLAFAAYRQYQASDRAWLIVVVLSAICLAIQYNRKDKLFIYKHVNKPSLQLFAEYLLLTIPFSCTSIITKNWFCFPLLLLLLGCISVFKFQSKHRAVLKNISAFIPASNLEWISGLRKQHIVFISLLLLAAAFSWVRILPLFLLWFITIIISSFFLENEPVHILRAGNKTARQFLAEKLRVNARYILLLYSLPVSIHAVFVPEFLLITLLFIPVQLALVSFAICLKYSSYKPASYPLGNNIAFSIIAMLSTVPYFLPVPVIFALLYFFKAEKNLKTYLHD